MLKISTARKGHENMLKKWKFGTVSKMKLRLFSFTPRKLLSWSSTCILPQMASIITERVDIFYDFFDA